MTSRETVESQESASTRPPLRPEQVREVVRRAHDVGRSKGGDAPVVGVYSEGEWTGGETLEVEGVVHRVELARGELELRSKLVRAEEDGEPRVIITPVPESRLGLDVMARLARAKLYPVDTWETLRELFNARSLDGTKISRAIADALIENLPSGGYPPAPAGVLDAGTLWRQVYASVLRMEDTQGDLPAFLDWTRDAGRVGRWDGMSPELRGAIRDRVGATIGPEGELLLDIVDAGHGADAAAIALVAGVVFHEEVGTGLEAARGRFERFTGQKSVAPASARRLAAAGEQLIDQVERLGHGDAAAEVARRADALLAELRAEDYAHLSSWTRQGLDQRLARFGEALRAALRPVLVGGEEATVDARTLGLAEERLQEVERHRLAASSGGTLERARMALRLARWRAIRQAGPDGSFEARCDHYVRELSFVDWGRESLLANESLTAVGQLYSELEAHLYQERQRWNGAFVESVAPWLQSPRADRGAIPVEDALERVVAPILERGHGVLLVVLDGMSWAVCHELLADVRRQRMADELWFDPAKGDAPPEGTLVATLPSETAYSRMSLLTGVLQRGDQAKEKKGFAACAAVASHCTVKKPPKLFHKDELTAASRSGGLGESVENEIADPSRKLVGVVVNAIDDELATGQQLHIDWTVDRIRPLRSLLRRAFEAERLVVWVSDHGHVFDRGADKVAATAGGARWRAAGEPVRAGEASFEGERVLEGRVIAPWDEAIRYGGKQNGYHGGASPQELLAPVVILGEPGAMPSGMSPTEHAPPAWWRLEEPGWVEGSVWVEESVWVEPESESGEAAPRRRTASELVPIEPASKKKTTRKKKTARKTRHDEAARDASPEPVAGADADDRAVRPATAATELPEWVDAFLASETYALQKQLMRRRAPSDEQVTQVFAALSGGAGQGQLTVAGFAQRVGQPSVRVAGFVATIQRILNVDGYDVLTFDRERNVVELDVELLKTQFEL